MSRKNFFRLTEILGLKHFSYFCAILRAVQMPYPDPPRQDLRSSANALLGPTPTEIAGNVGNTTGPVQMPYSDPPRQDLRGGVWVWVWGEDACTMLPDTRTCHQYL